MKIKIITAIIIIIMVSIASYFISIRVAYAKSIIEGRKYTVKGDFTKAAICYERALENNPENFEIYEELIALYKFQDKKEELKKIFEKGVKIRPNDLSFLINCGNFALREKNYTKAESYFARSAEIAQTDGNLYFVLGRIQQEQNKNNEAFASFQKAISLGFDKKRCYYNVACLYEYGFKDYQNALKYYELYLKNGGDDDSLIAKKMGSYSLWTKGQELENKGDYVGAIKDYEQKLEKNAGNLTIMSRLGRALRKNHQFPESEKLYLKALNMHKDNYYILNNLGSLYYDIERYDDAYACYRDAIKKEPNKPNAHYNMAALYTKKGDYKSAEDEYKQAQKLGYNENMVNLQLSYLYEKYIKDPVKAKEYKDKLVSLTENKH